MKRLALLVLAVTVSLGVAALTSAAVADAASFPYHTGPTSPSVTRDIASGGICTLSYRTPSQVYGFTREYVYWRVISWRVVNGQDELAGGAWQRAITNSSYGLETAFGSFEAWTNMAGTDPVYRNSVDLYRNVGYWIGYEIYWGSRGVTDRVWLGTYTCN